MSVVAETLSKDKTFQTVVEVERRWAKIKRWNKVHVPEVFAA
jgi:hypothetical protein